MLARGLAVAIAFGTVGCAYHTPPAHLPDSLPAISVRDSDVQVRVVRDGQPEAYPWAEARLRPWTVEILSDAAGARSSRGQQARVTVHIDVHDDSFWMRAFGPVCLFPAVLGVDSGYASLAVDVAIDTPEGSYRGHGWAKKWGECTSRRDGPVPAEQRPTARPLFAKPPRLNEPRRTFRASGAEPHRRDRTITVEPMPIAPAVRAEPRRAIAKQGAIETGRYPPFHPQGLEPMFARKIRKHRHGRGRSRRVREDLRWSCHPRTIAPSFRTRPHEQQKRMTFLPRAHSIGDGGSSA